MKDAKYFGSLIKSYFMHHSEVEILLTQDDHCFSFLEQIAKVLVASKQCDSYDKETIEE
jgi:hypothetical protein